MKQISFSIILLFCSGSTLNAQTYELSVLNEAYAPIQEAISLTQGEVWDDPEVTIPIGFETSYFSTTISELQLGGVGATLLTGDPYGPDPIGVLFPFEADIIDRGSNEDVSQSEILYATTGPVDDRVFTVEWNNVGFYGELNAEQPSNADFVNFQFQMFEATGVIRFHYGSSSVIQPDIAYEGSAGPQVGLIENYDLNSYSFDGEVLLLIGDPLDPEVETVFDYYDFVTLSGTPSEGTVYQFVPVPTGLIERGDIEVRLFPNPTYDFIQIRSSQSIPAMEYTITDLKGATLERGTITNDRVDVCHLFEGSYFIELRSEEGVARRSFSKVGR